MVAYTREKRRLAGPAFNTRSGVIRQPSGEARRLGTSSERERRTRQQLFQSAQRQLQTIRGLHGLERDAAFEQLFLELWTHKRLLTRTWLRAYIRIAAANLDVPAAAAFVLLTAANT